MDKHDRLADLPSVGRMLETAEAATLLATYPRAAVVNALRAEVEVLRQRVLAGEPLPPEPQAAVLAGAAAHLKAAWRPSLRPVINASGVIVHTNLGRSVLAESAARAVYETARHYSNLEADLETGRRSSRQVHIESRILQVVGGEAAAAFNNNAAAVMLALAAVARNREVIVSRGQLVEIGGSFRIPEVIEQSGCILREVGSTNRTHLRDYERAITDRTAAILRAHQSNYRIIGFTTEPGIEELVDLAHAHGLPLIDDLGSGALLDFAALGVGEEPMVGRSLAAGADVVTFSGDKLMGGPQCGIAVGTRDMIERMKKHPLARAVRVDKLTIAALAATLDLLADPQRAVTEIPTLRAATEPLRAVRERAEALAAAVQGGTGGRCAVSVHVDRSARVGGGSMPEQGLETAAVHLRLPNAAALSELARLLRVGEPAVYPRLQDDALVLDMRAVFPEEVADLARAVLAALDKLDGQKSTPLGHSGEL